MKWTNPEEEGENRGRTMMTASKWIPCVPRTSQMYPLVTMDICFCFFCPIHGHCYGFHFDNCREGRKDPFSVMYKYMETPPEKIFYDFACGLHEYCLNREPDFFKNTCFGHDIFHFINHTCGINFKSGRVLGLEGINSEICEQVNSYLQCVKYTSSHLSRNISCFLCSSSCIC